MKILSWVVSFFGIPVVLITGSIYSIIGENSSPVLISLGIVSVLLILSMWCDYRHGRGWW